MTLRGCKQTMNIFVPEPFAESACLSTILARAAGDASARPATLGDHAVMEDDRGIGVGLVRSRGARSGGVVLAGCSDEDAMRLGFAMAAFGAEPVPVHVECGGNSLHALAYLPDDPRRFRNPVRMRDWTARRRALLRETLAEIVSHYGSRKLRELPALLPGIGFRALARVRGAETKALQGRVRSGLLAAADIEPAANRSAYAKYFAVEEHRLRHRRYDGTMSREVERAVLVTGDAVAVLPFDPVRQTVLLIEQFRPGARARHDPSPWLVEPVAGRCDRIEDPETTARRELREEAGLEAGRLMALPGHYASPGTSTEFLTPFIAEADLSRAGGGVHGVADENEDIRSVVIPLDAALAAVESGEINVGPLILCLLWLQLHRDRLTRDWTASSAA